MHFNHRMDRCVPLATYGAKKQIVAQLLARALPYRVKAMVTNFGIVGKKLRESDPGAHLDCEVPLER